MSLDRRRPRPHTLAMPLPPVDPLPPVPPPLTPPPIAVLITSIVQVNLSTVSGQSVATLVAAFESAAGSATSSDDEIQVVLVVRADVPGARVHVGRSHVVATAAASALDDIAAEVRLPSKVARAEGWW